MFVGQLRNNVDPKPKFEVVFGTFLSRHYNMAIVHETRIEHEEHVHPKINVQKDIKVMNPHRVSLVIPIAKPKSKWDFADQPKDKNRRGNVPNLPAHVSR